MNKDLASLAVFFDVGASPYDPGIFRGITRVSEGCFGGDESSNIPVGGKTESGSAGTQPGEG